MDHSGNRIEPVLIQGQEMPVAWARFILYCAELENGEIEKLKIQNGIPMAAEVVKQRTQFT